MSGTARELLTWAAGEIGTLEHPLKSNNQPYAALAGHENGQAWCATFLVAGRKSNDVPLVPGTNTAWTPTMRTAFRTAGRLHDDPRPGDVGHVFYPNLDGGRIGHVFFVEKVSGDHVQTIEGNTNRDGSRVGMGVFRGSRRWRNGGQIRGIGRPPYGRPPTRPTVDLSNLIHAARHDPGGPQGATSFPSDVRIVEAALMAEGLLSRTYAKDGSFGGMTITAYSQWQRVCGFIGDGADGIPGRATLINLGNRHGFKVKEQASQPAWISPIRARHVWRGYCAGHWRLGIGPRPTGRGKKNTHRNTERSPLMTEQPHPDFDDFLDDPDDDATGFGVGEDEDADTDAADEPDPEED